MENDFQEIREKIVRGLEQTREKLMIEKAKNNKAIAISEDGKVKIVYPARSDK